MRIDPSASHVEIETQTRGLLAALAHDLRIEAAIAEGSTDGDRRCTARFDVAHMTVAASRRHGTQAWQPPADADARDIAGRIRREVFAGRRSVHVTAELMGDDAEIVVCARSEQRLRSPVRLDRDGAGLRVTGRCELSLEALGTGKVHAPLGAIHLDDRLSVRFDVRFVDA